MVTLALTVTGVAVPQLQGWASEMFPAKKYRRLAVPPVTTIPGLPEANVESPADKMGMPFLRHTIPFGGHISRRSTSYCAPVDATEFRLVATPLTTFCRNTVVEFSTQL